MRLASARRLKNSRSRSSSPPFSASESRCGRSASTCRHSAIPNSERSEMGSAPARATPSLPPLRLLVEQRFPLEMNVTLPQIRELYDSGKAGRWNPYRDIAWSALEPQRYDEP